jgi:uncharacterized protein (TIGR00369 family)
VADRTRPRPRVPPNCDLTLGVTCLDKSEPGVTVWSMPADERFANPLGVTQGGFVTALADTAMTTSTVTWASGRGERVLSANLELKISFLRPAAGDLVCTGRVISGGRRVVFAEAEIVDASGTLVAKASSSYLLTPRE